MAQLSYRVIDARVRGPLADAGKSAIIPPRPNRLVYAVNGRRSHAGKRHVIAKDRCLHSFRARQSTRLASARRYAGRMSHFCVLRSGHADAVDDHVGDLVAKLVGLTCHSTLIGALISVIELVTMTPPHWAGYPASLSFDRRGRRGRQNSERRHNPGKIPPTPAAAASSRFANRVRERNGRRLLCRNTD